MMNDKQMPPQPPSYGFTSAPEPQPMVYPPPQHGGYAPPPPQYGYPPQPPPGQGYPPAAGYPPQAYAAPQPPPHFQQPQPQPQAALVVPAGGWYSRNQKNKPQSNSASVAALIFISGGMNIAWSSGFRAGSVYWNPTHIRIDWFIGAIIGALISAFLANKVPKKIVGLFSAVLVTIAGIVVAATTYNTDAITAGLYLDGIANGLVFPPFIALVGEVSVFYMRGLNAATIDQLCFITGYMVQIIYVSCWSTSYYSHFTSDNMRGVLSTVYGILGIIFGALLCIESPVIELANGEEQKAIDILRRLQRPYTVTNETYEQLAEHKLYLAQNKDLTVGQSIVRAIPAFLRLCFLRALNAMSLAAYVTYTIAASLLAHSSSLEWCVGFGLCRWFGNFITTFCMESVGRKKPILIGLLVCGGMSFGIASQYSYRFSGIPTMMLVFQFFAGVAFTATTPYLTEAYPLGVKQHFIAFTFIVEMLVFLIIGACTWSVTGGANYFYIIGVLYLIGFIAGIFCLPETKGTTLRQAQDKFKGISSRGF
ncbi:probable metabolite transport protein CsbC [Drosophila tropicalis]|uniref:probable metabolite transport protein CsbC n=1 Tax=Drosophila tropicalis TaxID=46794 RepID=UPI0035ABD1CF